MTAPNETNQTYRSLKTVRAEQIKPSNRAACEALCGFPIESVGANSVGVRISKENPNIMFASLNYWIVNDNGRNYVFSDEAFRNLYEVPTK